MKKKLLILLLGIMIIATCVFFFSCKKEHMHSYAETVTAPTRTKVGYTTYTCECGYTKNGNYIQATASTGLEIKFIGSRGDAMQVVGIGTCTDTDIEIPSEYYVESGGGRILPVQAIGEDAFMDLTSVNSVIIPDSVTSIGKRAFNGCISLTSVTIPNSVTNIEFGAFMDCVTLTNITIPSSVTSIADSAFWGCTNLTNVTLNEGLTSIGGWAFHKCSSLSNIILPQSVTTIEAYAFLESGITHINIPNNVSYIQDGTFQGCKNLLSATIPISVRTIGDYAFVNCTSLITLNYRGNESQWDAISKGLRWDEYSYRYNNAFYYRDLSYTVVYNYKNK